MNLRDIPLDITELRERLNNISQENFALLYEIPFKTLQKWESKQWQPDAVNLVYLLLIQHFPIEIAAMLNQLTVEEARK